MHKVALEKPPVALKAANFFGVLGYIALLIEWTWLICLLAYPAVKNGDLDWIMPAQNPNPAPVVVPAPVNGTTVVIAIIVTVICLIIVAYALYALPRSIGKTGAKLTHSAAASVIPTLERHRKVTKKSRLKLTLRAITTIKLITLSLPLLIAFAVPSFSALSRDVVLLSTLFLAACTLFYFAVQFAIIKFAKLNPNHAW